MKVLYILFLSCTPFLHAQKILKKSFINPTNTAINIDVKNCYELSLESIDSKEIIVEAVIEGEYSKDLLVNVREEGNTLWVSTDFEPNFINPNDKLSAHKVISIALTVKLPNHKNVLVYGTSCNVAVKGMYKNLGITLNDGRCILNEVGETVNVTTQSGDIHLSSSKAKIKAISKYGTVLKANIPIGDNYFNINTATGNVYLNKTE